MVAASLYRMIRDTTPWLSPHAPEADKNGTCYGSHRPPYLCKHETPFEVSIIALLLYYAFRRNARVFLKKFHKKSGMFLRTFIDFFKIVWYNGKAVISKTNETESLGRKDVVNRA